MECAHGKRAGDVFRRRRRWRGGGGDIAQSRHRALNAAILPELARHLLARSAKRPVEQVGDLLTAEAIDMMYEYEWPGNVRELANAMEYAYIVAASGPITAAHLPQQVRLRRAKPPTAAFFAMRHGLLARPSVVPRQTVALIKARDREAVRNTAVASRR